MTARGRPVWASRRSRRPRRMGRAPRTHGPRFPSPP